MVLLITPVISVVVQCHTFSVIDRAQFSVYIGRERDVLRTAARREHVAMSRGLGSLTVYVSQNEARRVVR